TDGVVEVVGHRRGERVHEGPEVAGAPGRLDLVRQHGPPPLHGGEVDPEDLGQQAAPAAEVVVQRRLVAGPDRLVGRLDRHAGHPVPGEEQRTLLQERLAGGSGGHATRSTTPGARRRCPRRWRRRQGAAGVAAPTSQAPAAAASRANSSKSRGGRPSARCTPSASEALRPSRTVANRSASASTSAGGRPAARAPATYSSRVTGT